MSDWHLICITRLGKVSMLKNLDLHTARETYKRLMPDQYPKDYKFPDCKVCGKHGWSWSGGGFSYSSTDDRLERVEAIGPEGEELKPWEGVEPRIVDMRHLCRCEKPKPKEAPLVAPLALTAFEERALAEAAREEVQ